MKNKISQNKLLTVFIILCLLMSMLCNFAYAEDTSSAESSTQVVSIGGEESRADGLVKVSKTIEGTDTENVFDITLRVETKERLQTQLEAADTAIVIVMDISQTMNYTINATSSTSRYEAAMASAENFMTKFQQEAAKHTDVSYKLGYVAFNRDATEIFPLSPCYTEAEKNALVEEMKTDTEAIIKKANYATAQDRWTNIEAGLKRANDLLADADEQHKYVIFLSDGFPTTYVKTEYTGYIPTMSSTAITGWVDTKAYGQDGYFYNQKTNKLCYAGTSYSDKAATRAETMAAAMKTNKIKIYSIGVGLGEQQISGFQDFVIDCYPEGNDYVIGAGTEDFKEWLKNDIGSGFYYDSYDTEALSEAYENIFKDILKTNEESIKTAWISSDPMSSTAFSKVEFLKFYNKAGQLVDGNLTNPEGQTIENEATLIKNNGIDEISWDLKHSVYETKTEESSTVYLYDLKYRVRLSNEATDFVENQAYETNGVTKLTYRINKNGILQTPETLYYPLPQVKGYLGEFAFFKKDSKTGNPVSATFTLTHKDDCTSCAKIYDSKIVDIDAMEVTADAEGIVSFTEIPSGHEYVLNEKTAVPGYEPYTNSHAVTVSYDTVTIDGKSAVTKDELANLAQTSTQDASFTTVENIPLNKLIVKKDVTGDRDEAFFTEGAFSIKVTNEEGNFEETLSLPVNDNGTLRWETALDNLPADTYLVTETNAASGGEGYNLTTKVDYPSASGKEATSVVLSNGDEKQVVVTNNYEYIPDSTNFTAYKVWADDTNRDGMRPLSVRFALYVNGSKVPGEEKDVTTAVEGENNKFSVTFTYDKIKYKGQASVKEIGYTDKDGYHAFTDEMKNVPGYETTENADTITNTHTPDTTKFTVKKVWGNGTKGREKPVTVRLLANGSEVASAVINPDGDMTYTFKETEAGEPLYVYQNGEKIQYTLTEDDLGYGYYQKVESSDTGWLVTNTYSVYTPPTISKTVTKVWVDENDKAGVRPDSITVQLYRNDIPYKTKVLDAANNWTYTFTGLLETSAWTISEVDVPEGYTSSITENKDTFTIINTYEHEEEQEPEENPVEKPVEKPGNKPDDNLPPEENMEAPSEKPAESTNEDFGEDLEAVPKTADNSHFVIWFGIAVLSAVLLRRVAKLAKTN